MSLEPSEAIELVEQFKPQRQSIGQWAEGMGLSVPSNKEVMHTLGRFGMKRFAGAVMWVLREVFAMPSFYQICEPNEKAGHFLLDEIMMAGNFGKYDERNRQMQGASKLKRFWLLTKRNWQFLTQYPSEVILILSAGLIMWCGGSWSCGDIDTNGQEISTM